MRLNRRWLMLIFMSLLFFETAFVFAETAPSPVAANPLVFSDQSGSNPPVMNAPQGPGQSDAMTDIIDIKPIEKIGYDTRIIRYILYAVLALVLLLLIVYLLDRLINKNKKGKSETTVVMPPDQIAILNLNELEAMTDLEEKEFYFRLTAIVRTYIKGRFSLDAPEMTTEELLPKIPSIPIDKTLSTGLKDLLNTTDPVKFAGVSAGQEKIRDNMDFAKRFVEMTRVVPEDKEKENVA